MFNHWNIEVKHGLNCDYSYGRNGTDKLTGRIQSVDMRRLLDALPAILGPIGRHSYDGGLYRCLPWADKTELDFMVSAE